MEIQHFKKIIDCYLRGDATPDEIRLVETFLRSQVPTGSADQITDKIVDDVLDQIRAKTGFDLVPQELAGGQEQQPAPVIEMGREAGQASGHRRRRLIWGGAAAACIVVLSLSGFWLLNKPGQGDKPIMIAKTLAEVKPGMSGATLTLANGRVVVLDTAANGMLAGGVVKKADALYIADLNSPENNGVTEEPVIQQALVTSRAKHQLVTLDDGTKVLLNSASSISFPTRFTGNTREVTITGEADFEVAKNPSKPFFVRYGNNEPVQVVGTHFNINAYQNEGAPKVTLLEGTVRVAGKVLSPGQQYSAGKVRTLNEGDMAAVTAWKSGFFEITDLNAEAILRQYARWYDVEVVYENRPDPNYLYSGRISQNNTLDVLVQPLQQRGSKFRIENGKLIVNGK